MCVFDIARICDLLGSVFDWHGKGSKLRFDVCQAAFLLPPEMALSLRFSNS
jgi:hypothetical protein